jgi:hypothetical protein
MSDPYLPAPREFQDLVPWADPYIASLLHKLGAESVEASSSRTTEYRPNHLGSSHLEATMPVNFARDERQRPWRQDWMPRRWPRG